jgi:dihydrofolate synthase/folylpolyglutamate synthase
VSEECRARSLSAWRVGHEIQVADGPRGVDVTTPMERYSALPLMLHGAFQRDNLAAAVAAAERRLGTPMRIGPLRRAVGRVTMPGRLEVVGDRPLVILDGAHNPAGVEAMAASLQAIVDGRRTVAVVSILGDKDVAAMVAPLAGVCTAVIATRSSHPRAAAPAVIAHLAKLAGMETQIVEDPLEAVRDAYTLAGEAGAVLVCGSLYLLADVRDAVMAAM